VSSFGWSATPGVDDVVLDVRLNDEYRAGHLPGSIHVELGSLGGADATPPGPITVMCEHAQRATTGASILERAGHREITVAFGGAAEWSAATGRPLERS
jgi:rhodanese-related sulfurtransferase